jgi:hypothetical protein
VTDGRDTPAVSQQLTLLAGLLAWQNDWPGAALISGLLTCYLLMFRLTRCRVETLRHRPCRWRVRGLLGTCDYHVGCKRGLPVLARANNYAGLPTFMWPRGDFTHTPARPEPQPSQAAAASAATSQRARRPRYDWAMMALAAAGVAVALASFTWDVLTR